MASTTESGPDGEYVPSPLERICKQVSDYEATGGFRTAPVVSEFRAPEVNGDEKCYC